MTYQWITASTLRSEDGRTIQIIKRRDLKIRLDFWFIREVTQTQIRDHHFPEVRTFAQIAKEARQIAEKGEAA